MTLRYTLFFLASTFNFISSIFCFIAFFKLYPEIMLAYLLISLPIQIYTMLAKPNKYLDTKFTDIEVPKSFSLGSNPF